MARNPHPKAGRLHAAWRAGFLSAGPWFGTHEEWHAERRFYTRGRWLPSANIVRAYLAGRAAGAALFDPKRRK